jgi:CubicO group peptidase (beta-lactamase class C family)
MKTWVIGACALLSACAGTGFAESAKTPVPVWDLAKDAFAATTGRIERVDGRVVMDGASAFAFPNSAIPDASCFTISMEIRFHSLEEREALQLLDQRVSDTGFAVDVLKWGAVGSPLTTTVNGVGYGRNSFQASTNQVWPFVFAVRDGAVTVYQNKSAGPQYLLRITPNLAPVWVGRTQQARKDLRAISGYEILSLKVYGPDYKFYLPGESADTLKNGIAFSGIAGWAGAASAPEMKTVSEAVQAQVDKGEIAGAVSLVLTPDRVVHFAACGQSDLAAKTPMAKDAMFWIASMTKPIVGCAIMMLQDEGKLSVNDPAVKYLPELAGLKTADGRTGRPTLKHLLTHTSGLSEPTDPEALASRTLAELVPHFASKPLQSLPGERWQYSQAGINALGRIVEVVSGKPLPEFLRDRLFCPLGMKDTTFYPDAAQQARIAKSYRRVDGRLEEAHVKPVYDFARGNDRYPAANGGLYSTAADYGRFCQMLLNRGTLDGKRILSPEAVSAFSSIQSGDLKTGFVDGMAWGLGCGVVRQPQGVTAALSPGTFGHGGAYGTQAWVDPVRRVAYVLMVQRANFPNGDASDVRRVFQVAAAQEIQAGSGISGAENVRR